MTNTENSFENTEPVCVWMCVCGCGCVYNKVRVIMSPGKPADMITQARLVQLSSGLSWGPLQPRWGGGTAEYTRTTCPYAMCCVCNSIRKGIEDFTPKTDVHRALPPLVTVAMTRFTTQNRWQFLKQWIFDFRQKQKKAAFSFLVSER